MNKDIKRIYIAISDNQPVAFETNLKNFWERFVLVEPEIRNYDYFYRKFKKDKSFSFTSSSGKEYVISYLEDFAIVKEEKIKN